MSVVLEIVFIIAVVVSLFSNFYGVPGNFLIVVSSFVYGIITSFAQYSFTFVITLLLIVLLVEFLEYMLIVLTAKKYGASKWGIIGAVVGGIGGAISGAFFTPVIGAIIGSIIGVFAGATLLEFFKSYDIREALLSGVGAFLGKIGGLSIKICGAVTIIIMIGYKVL